MHIITTLLVLATSTSATVLSTRQNNSTDEEAYLAKVCSPEVTSGPIPPCVSINNIEQACLPNNTTPLALEAHAQCICGGSFFSDWEGCLACNTVHGARAPPVAAVFLDIISTVSDRLCTGTPTAPFASIFEQVRATAGAEEAAGGVPASDRYPDQTAVSLYYTLVTSQGPGAITGSATAATNTRNVVPTDGSRNSTSDVVDAVNSRTTTTTSTSLRSTNTVASAATSSTSSSSSGARETGAWIGGLGFIAGGAALAAL